MPVWAGAQEGGADGGLELADLAGEDGVPDAELAGCVAEAGLAGEGEEPSDALLGARVGEDSPDVRGGGNAPGPPKMARGWGRPLMPCRTRMPACRAAAARASTVVPVSAAMSLRLRWRSWYCPRSQCESMAPSGRRVGWRSPVLVRSCPMVRSLHPVIRAILRGPYPCPARSRSWSVPGGPGSGRGCAGLPGGSWGAGWRAAVSRTWSAVVPSRAAMARTGRPARMRGCRSAGRTSSGSGPGQVTSVTQFERGLPGDGLVDAGLGEQ